MSELIKKVWDFLRSERPMRALCCIEVMLAFMFIFYREYQQVDSIRDYFAPLFEFGLTQNTRIKLLVIVIFMLFLYIFIGAILEKLRDFFPTKHQEEPRNTNKWVSWIVLIKTISGVCLFVGIIALTLDLMAAYYQNGKIEDSIPNVLSGLGIICSFIYLVYILFDKTYSRVSRYIDVEETTGYCDNANVPILIGDKVAYHHKIYEVDKVQQTIILIPRIYGEKQISLLQALDDGGLVVLNANDKRKR